MISIVSVFGDSLIIFLEHSLDKAIISSMQLFCIGHKEPTFTPPLPFVFVSPLRVPRFDQIIIKDDWNGELMHGSIISEYTQLFGLAKYLATRTQEELLYLFQYRKFLSFKKGQSLAINIPYAYPVNARDAELFFPTAEEILCFKSHFMVGAHMIMHSMYDNYARGHIEEDFLNFLKVLRHHPEFGPHRSQLFSECKILFPSPAIGVVPTDVFCRHMQLLAEVWLIFANKYYVPRAGYQRRVGGFLLERLHSFLLSELFFPTIKASVTEGYHMVVSDSLIISVS